MRVKNISARPHHVGDVTIIPGDEKDIPDSFANAINKNDLIEIKAPTEHKDEEVKPVTKKSKAK